MGKWNYRRTWRPKNYYRDQRIPSPPTYYDTEFKLRGAWKNVDLPWEERFCISVGIPWEKVVNAKKYMHCYDNVVKWNDSASEASFSDSKKRFWAKINNIPSDVPYPDPNIYLQEIDWNPKIDLELVNELEQAYFNPDEPQKVENANSNKKEDNGLVPGCILGLHEDPWEHNKNANLNGWNCSNNSVNKNISDPWEQGISQEIKDISCGGGASSSWHKDSTWGGGATASSSWHKDSSTWGGGARNSWHCNQYDLSKNTWGSGYGSNRNVSKNTSQWGDYRDGSFGRESNVGCRKREGCQQYTSGYKSARVQSDGYREGNRYRR